MWMNVWVTHVNMVECVWMVCGPTPAPVPAAGREHTVRRQVNSSSSQVFFWFWSVTEIKHYQVILDWVASEGHKKGGGGAQEVYASPQIANIIYYAQYIYMPPVLKMSKV